MIKNDDMINYARATEKSEWKPVVLKQQIEVCRNGWWGVWDALVSAVKNQPRFNVSQETTISFYVKTQENANVTAHITQTQLEMGN